MEIADKANLNDIYGQYYDLLHLCDVRIISKDGIALEADKVILSSSCDYFKRLFAGLFKSETEYNIKDINGKVLKDIFTFIYTKNISVSESNINDLLLAADYFLIKDLYVKVKECAKSIITVSNCISFLETAYKVYDNEILGYGLTFIVRHFENFGLHDFDEMPMEIFKRILNSVNLNVKNENTVFHTIVRWIQADPETRTEHIRNLLSVLAVDQIDDELQTEILEHEIVSKNISSSDRRHNVIEGILMDFNLKDFRIPKKLNLMSRYSFAGNVQLFVSYDETHDLWHKIVDLPFFIPAKLIASGSYAYIFEENPLRQERCWRLNIHTMEWKEVHNLFSDNASCIFEIEKSIYVLMYENQRHHLEVYDVTKNKRCRLSSIYIIR